MSDVPTTIAILGGTGPQGRGLAARWARVGHRVLVGSRDRDRAGDVAASIRDRIGGGDVRGAANEEAAAAAEVVVVAVPYEAQASLLPSIRDAVGAKLVVNVVNPMSFDDVGPKAVAVGAGSAAEECQELLPGARVVSAFHHVPAKRLWDVDEPVGCDVLVCGDDEDGKGRVADLAASVPGMRGVDCGPLRNSQHVENMTPVLLAINRRYGVQAAVRIDGIGRGADDGTRRGRGAP